MTTTLLTLIPGLLAGLGICLVVVAVRPPMTSLQSAVETLSISRIDVVAQDTWQHRLGRWVDSRGIPGATAANADLELLGITRSEHYFRKAIGAIVGLVVPLALPVVLAALGLSSTIVLVFAVLPLACAALGWLMPDTNVRRRATTARGEFARAVAIYLEMVAGSLRSGGHPTSALLESARVGESWPFRRMETRLQRALLTGQHPWDALAELSDEVRVPELRDVGTIVSLAAESGASVYEALMNRGTSLRTQLLSDFEAEENSRTQRLSLPQLLSSFVVALIVLVPMLATLLDPSGLTL